MAEEKKKKKKGNYGKVAGYCVVVGCAAALLAWLVGDGGFGFGEGFGGLGGGQGQNGANGGYNAYQEQAYNPDVVAGEQHEPEDEHINDPNIPEPELPVLIIRVVNNNIYHGDDPISTDDLVRLFEDINQPGFVWELRDEQAIMETYENVKVLMNENGIVFTER